MGFKAFFKVFTRPNVEMGFCTFEYVKMIGHLNGTPFGAQSLLRIFFLAHRVLSKRGAPKNGGGGSRTRVPRAFMCGIYMLSFEFIVVTESLLSGLFSSQALYLQLIIENHFISYAC
jgi:hypothetical protein